MKTVLVPLDLGREADRALPVGAALAARMGAELDVVCVTTPGLRPELEETEIRMHARAAGVDIDGVRLSYDEEVARGILAETTGTDSLLCCATHARGHIADLFFHSVSGQLLRGSRSPLVLVGPHVPASPPALTELLVCVDDRVDDRMVTAVATFARLLSASVQAVQVFDPGLPQPYPTAKRLGDLLEERDVGVTWSLHRHPHPATAILEHADQMDGPLIVMGVNDERPDRPANLGSVSLSVVHRAACPVLVVPAAPAGPSVASC